MICESYQTALKIIWCNNLFIAELCPIHEKKCKFSNLAQLSDHNIRGQCGECFKTICVEIRQDLIQINYSFVFIHAYIYSCIFYIPVRLDAYAYLHVLKPLPVYKENHRLLPAKCSFGTLIIWYRVCVFYIIICACLVPGVM